MTFEVDVLKEILTEIKKTNDLLEKIVNIQPKEATKTEPKPRRKPNEPTKNAN